MCQAMIGMLKNEIDTPALLIDLKLMENNIAKMADFFRGVEADLRPHIKTHKIPILAHKQLEAGAIGITSAKLGEAEVMASAGIREILIANQVAGAHKVQRLVELARHANIIVAVDDRRNVMELSEAATARGAELGVLVEVDVGMKRCGVEPGEPALLLSREADRASGLRYMGLMGYEGHIITLPDYEERRREAERSMKLLVDTKHLIEEDGLEVSIVGGGGTGTYDITGRYPEVTEVQAGSYIVMDSTYHKIRPEFECALTLLTTVISVPNSQRAILDAGRKSVSQDFGLPEVSGIEGIRFRKLSEEHGILESTGPRIRLKPGDKIEVIPSHCCTTINLHDKVYGIRDDGVEAIWDIAGRGRAS